MSGCSDELHSCFEPADAVVDEMADNNTIAAPADEPAAATKPDDMLRAAITK